MNTGTTDSIPAVSAASRTFVFPPASLGSWAHEEMYRVQFWDRRCLKSVVGACEQLAEAANSSLSTALGPHRNECEAFIAQAISHLFHSPRISAEELLHGHVLATAARCKMNPLDS